jgi:hypothetical protein
MALRNGTMGEVYWTRRADARRFHGGQAALDKVPS